MTLQTIKKLITANIIIIILACFIFILALNACFIMERLSLWLIAICFSLGTIAICILNILNHKDTIKKIRYLEKVLSYEKYTAVQHNYKTYLPLCFEVALEKGNITFYAKLQESKDDLPFVCISAKRDDSFIDTETLTDKNPLYMDYKEFYDCFKV